MDVWERRAEARMRELRAQMAEMRRTRRARGAALCDCVDAGWTVADLARELGVSRGTVYRWMSDADAE